MAWLPKKTMQKKQQELSVVPHPILSQIDLSLGTKMMYLQGCVLAALLDDEKVSDEERQNIHRIGRSLGLSLEEISECLTLVGELKSDEDKEAFLEELKGGVSEYPISKFFMVDFEEIMKKKGRVPKASIEFLDFVGGQIVGKEDWRKGLLAAARKKASASKDTKKTAEKPEEPKKARGNKPAQKKDDDTPEYGFGDKVWRTNEEHGGVECSFEGKPSEAVRSKLKAGGFRFSGKQGFWYAKDTDRSRKVIQSLKLSYAGTEEPDEAPSAEEDTPILASELIGLIESNSIEAQIEDEDECKPQIKSTDIESAYSDGECKLIIRYGFPDDGTAGRLVFDVGGVHFSSDRNFDGEHEPFEISGREIEYDEDLDEDSILEAVEDNVSITEFDPDDYEFDEDNVDASEVENALDNIPDYLAVDDGGTVYMYDDEDEIDEDYEQIELSDAIAKMLETNSQVEFERE